MFALKSCTAVQYYMYSQNHLCLGLDRPLFCVMIVVTLFRSSEEKRAPKRKEEALLVDRTTKQAKKGSEKR